MLVTVYPAKLKGVQMAPASKSSMQRACAAALLHEGETVIHNPGHSNDDILFSKAENLLSELVNFRVKVFSDDLIFSVPVEFLIVASALF